MRATGRSLLLPRLALGVAAVVAASLLPLAAAPADAAGVRTMETGTVKFIADGDTVWVDIATGGSGRRSVRLAGIQATETRHAAIPGSYNQCHGVQAKAALSRLVLHKKVQLRARAKSSRSLGRLLRYLYVKQGGRWVDVQALLLKQDQVMSLTLEHENSHDGLYSRLAQQAAATGRGLWHTTTCGTGPAQVVPLRTWVHWDAAGADSSNPNDEYVVVENHSRTTTLSLRGWKLRDTSQAMYHFPTWAKIAPGSFVRVRVGKGRNTATDLHWNLKAPLFQNPDQSPGTSDFAVLMDPKGDFRSWASYPCLYRCADPLSGRVSFSSIVADSRLSGVAGPNGEQVVIRNSSDQAVRLSGYYVVINGWLMYTFSPQRSLAAHSTVTLRMGKGTNTTSTVYLNQSSTRLPNDGGTVKLRNWNGVQISCDAWGNKHC